MDMRTYLLMKKRALLQAANQFFLPNGLTAANVLAAYRFVGVNSEANALKDLSGNGLTLTKYGSVTWNTATGFTFPETTAAQGPGNHKLNNTALNGKDIKCVVLRYADISLDNRDYLMAAGGSSNKARIYGTSTLWGGYELPSPAGLSYDYQVRNFGGLGYHRVDNSTTHLGRVFKTSTKRASGVVGANFDQDDALFYNGSKITSTTTYTESTVTYEGHAYQVYLQILNTTDKATFGNIHPNRSNLNNGAHSGHKILGAAFYNVALSAAQHAEVAAAMALW